MAIVDRQVFGLGLVNLPLGKWEIRGGGDVIYEVDSQKLGSDKRSGVEKVIVRVGIVDQNQIKIDYLVRITPPDGELPKLHVYEPESSVIGKEEINRVLRLGCAPGKKKQIQWKE